MKKNTNPAADVLCKPEATLYAALSVSFDPKVVTNGVVTDINVSNIANGCVGLMMVFSSKAEAEAFAGKGKTLEIKTV